MNQHQPADADVKQEIQCNQKIATKKKHKKAKEPSSTADNVAILNHENLSESLANKLRLNNINNGTSEHLDESDDLSGSFDKLKAQEIVSSNAMSDVNSVHCNETVNSSSSQKHCEYAIENHDTIILDSILNKSNDEIEIVSYESELQMPEIMKLIQKDLSEPYSIYTYRYFIHNWPKLCFLATHEGICIGAIVCKLDMHRNVVKRGYIAMLAVDEKYRKRKIGSRLVQKAIQAMINDNADEVVLETEITNKAGLKLYENLGFVRDKRLFRYYLNGVDALRLKLWLR